MHQLIAAYTYMRYYQTQPEFQTSKFKMAFRKCYEIMTDYYCALFLDQNKTLTTHPEFKLALKIFQVISIQKNLKDGLSCLTPTQANEVIHLVDKQVHSYYTTNKECQAKHPRLKDYLISASDI